MATRTDWEQRAKDEVARIMTPERLFDEPNPELLELIWLSGYKAGLVDTVQDILGKESDLPK